jgi:hypothetical protein
MKTYAWTCLACDATNDSGRAMCGRCGCAASTTSKQVQAARDAFRSSSGLPPVAAADPLALIREMPWLPIGAVVLMLLGGLALIVSENGGTTAFGCLMLALAALCASSWRPRARARPQPPMA